MNSSESVSKAKRGERQAVVDLLNGYRNYLRLLAQVYVGQQLQSKLDASDLVQESLLAACRDFRQFRGQSEQELAGWLRAIMTNTGRKMIRQYRNTKRRDIGLEKNFGQGIDQSAASIDNLAAPISSPSHRANRREAAVVLADKLAELPDHYRQAIVLHHLEGQTIAEVAEAIDRSPEATNSLLARALIKLRSLMKDPT